MAGEDTTLSVDEQGALEQAKALVDSAISSVTNFFGGTDKPAEELAARQQGELVIPAANPSQGLTGWDKLKMRGAGFASGDIDMIDDMKMRYPDLELTGALTALHENTALQNEVMTMLRENENLPHHLAQQLQGNEELTAQFEDLIRNDPDAFKAALPQIEENPEQFSEIIAGIARDPAEASAANDAAVKDGQGQFMEMMSGILSGDITFSELLGPKLGGMLDGFLGPLMEMFQGLVGSVKGFVAQNVDPDSPILDLAEAAGVDTSFIKDAAAPEGQDPSVKPQQNADLAQQQGLSNPAPTVP